jgi:pimeloyl-ACP methyl ester carboxylesterase
MAGLNQKISFCKARDGARIAMARLGHGSPLVRAAHWLSHVEHDPESPVWSAWLRELSRDHTYIRYDQRGCGLSDWSPPANSFESWVNDLEAVVDAQGLERFPLLGMSQGGAMRLDILKRFLISYSWAPMDAECCAVGPRRNNVKRRKPWSS